MYMWRQSVRRRRLLEFVLTAFGMVSITLSGCGVAEPAVYVTPQEISLGDVVAEDVADEHVEGTFYLVNQFGRPVNVIDVRPSCRCSNVTISPNPIPPGRTGTVLVTADIAGMVGQQQVVVTIFTDCVEFPVHRIALNANIRSLERERHGKYYLGRFWPDTDVRANVDLSLFGADRIQLRNRREITSRFR